jgi:acyl-CoA dehydrogenase
MSASWFLLLPGFLIAAAAVPPLRRLLFTGPLFRMMGRKMPPISRTEREALEAGTVGWDGELFSGHPSWKRLLALAPPRLTAEEEAFLAGPVEELCRMLDDWRIVEEYRDLPPEVWTFLKEKGFFGLIIPKAHGGLGFSAYAHSQVIIRVGSRSCAAAVTVMVPNSLGPAELLVHYGTQAQKDHFLPRLARGEDIPCFALTGPEAGSDAASIPDTGVVCMGLHEGRETLGIRLDWEKRYITLAPVATLLGLAFRLSDPEGLLPEGEPGITVALIPTDTAGITIGSRHDPLGIPFQNGPTWGRDVFVPLDRVIGGAKGAGKGWRMLMECLAAGRSISLPALSTGGGKLAALAVGAYARIRRQFHMSIGRFEGIEEALARIAGNAYVMDAARGFTCAAVDRGERPAVASAIAKYHCTERMRASLIDGMDIMGGAGISMGPRNVLARAHQSTSIAITVEGANILTRTLIVFGQGAIRCHPYVLKEMLAMEAGDVRTFDRLLLRHGAFAVGNGVRALLHALTGSRLARAPRGPARRIYQATTRWSAAFAVASDLALLTLGGNLKRKEKLSGRCSDILSNLYLLSAMLKAFEDQGRPRADLPLLRYASEDCLWRIQEAFQGLLRNLPSRPAAWLLKVLVFPLGRPQAGPSDALGHQAATLLMAPSEARDRLTAGLHLASLPLSRLEDALSKVAAAEPAERKLAKAAAAGRIRPGSDVGMLLEGIQAGEITPEEGEAIRQSIEARRDVITVDDFPTLERRTTWHGMAPIPPAARSTSSTAPGPRS